MVRTNILAGACLVAALLSGVRPALADLESIIVIGKVTMADGSPPPFTVSVERECSDLYGSAPGPPVNKKGVWVWRLDIETDRTRSCVFLVHHSGYTSTTVDASNLNVKHLDRTVNVPDIVLNPTNPDPYTIHMSGDDFPAKSKRPFDQAMKALDARNMDEAIKDLQASVEIAPKFGEGWHALGVV